MIWFVLCFPAQPLLQLLHWRRWRSCQGSRFMNSRQPHHECVAHRLQRGVLCPFSTKPLVNKRVGDDASGFFSVRCGSTPNACTCCSCAHSRTLGKNRTQSKSIEMLLKNFCKNAQSTQPRHALYDSNAHRDAMHPLMEHTLAQNGK